MDRTQSTFGGDSVSEERLLRDIAYLERQVKRLARPSSTWERGALNCYRVLAGERKKMLAAIKRRADT